MNLGLWLRWSWRDLKARWLQVVAIALIIALGTGVFASSAGQRTWREKSYDLSYGRLNMYDIKMELADGSFVDESELQNAMDDIGGISLAEPRLITPTLVDASHGDETILVRGEIVGVNVNAGGPQVNRVFVDDESGRTLNEADAGTNAVVVEYKFAKTYDLQPGDPIHISGDVPLEFVGAGHSPEYFLIVQEAGNYLGQSSFAALFISLETAQRLAGRDGLVNNMVFLLEEGADRDAVRAEIEQQMAETFPQVGFQTFYKEDDPVYTLSYQDAKGDQATVNAIAFLFLIGAALGAFNLAGRLVESQRRQIGIGMALGVPRFWIALRPMLVGLQIAVLGTIFGLVIGLVLGQAYGNLLKDFTPLPYWEISFYTPGFIQASILGILLPFIATLIPVIRAVRVAPVDAITSGYLVSKGKGWSRLANYLPLPGKSFTQMPLRNILRAPWRTMLTVLGITIAIMLMTTVVGAADSYGQTMQQADDAFRYQAGDRALINLNFFYPVEDGVVSDLTHLTDENGQRLFQQIEPALMLGGTLIHNGEEIDTALELHNMETALWVPALIEESLTSDQPGIILSQKAANDLSVGIGDTITLRHPRREGMLSFQLVETQVPVIGIHNNPLRPLSYMDMRAASLMGLEGTSNLLVANPAADVGIDTIKAALLVQPGVASVRSIRDFSDNVQELVQILTATLAITEVVAVFLAFLIAFNATSISVDERVREIATMFAFGLPVRTATRMQMLENLVIGVLGTLLGVALGWLVLSTVLFGRVETQIPDLKFVITIAPQSILLGALIGVVVVTLTPLLSMRKMRRMDIPSTLRVME